MRVSVKVRSPRWPFPRGEVERQVTDAQQPSLTLEAPTEEGAQAGQQLRQCVGLDQVVVGTRIETLDAVVDGVARGEHQHRCVVPRTAHAPAHGQPVEVGQSQVEDRARRVGSGPGSRAPRPPRGP